MHTITQYAHAACAKHREREDATEQRLKDNLFEEGNFVAQTALL